MSLYIGVIGPSENVSDELSTLAEGVGFRIAQSGAILVCGGRSGVMESTCKGAHRGGGITIGILPGLTREDANSYVDISIPTGLGLAMRNFITVRSCDAVIMINGEVGTLSEAIIAYQHGKPVVAIEPSGGWAERLHRTALDDGRYFDHRHLVEIHYVATAEQAVDLAISLTAHL
jgi:uncharacterized protein (TIGR00725 family)